MPSLPATTLCLHRQDTTPSRCATRRDAIPTPSHQPILAILLLATALLAACRSSPEPFPAPAAQPRPLDAATLRQTLVTHTLTRSGGPFWRPWDYAGVHRPDGTMTASVTWQGRGGDRATGAWEITPKGHYCRTWSNDWADGKPGCFQVTRYGATLIFDHESGVPGDAGRYRYRLRPGNPFGL